LPAGKIATLKTQGLCGHAGSWKLKVAGKKCVEVSNLLSLAGCKASSMNAVVILADACHQCAQLHLDIPSFSSCTRTIKKNTFTVYVGDQGKGVREGLGGMQAAIIAQPFSLYF
jgi:predicted secreted protein